jgi:hypothetical protein
MVLLLVMAVIFFIAMNNFKSIAPSALELQKHNKAGKARRDIQSEYVEPTENAAGSSPSASGDSWTPSAPSRPNLSTMDQKTSEHTAAVTDAASQAN